MRNELFESAFQESQGEDADLAEIESNLYELYDSMDEILRKYRVPTGSRENLFFNITSVLANGYKLGASGESLEEWTYKFGGYSKTDR
jgi:hypothetical protein